LDQRASPRMERIKKHHEKARLVASNVTQYRDILHKSMVVSIEDDVFRDTLFVLYKNFPMLRGFAHMHLMMFIRNSKNTRPFQESTIRGRWMEEMEFHIEECKKNVYDDKKCRCCDDNKVLWKCISRVLQNDVHVGAMMVCCSRYGLLVQKPLLRALSIYRSECMSCQNMYTNQTVLNLP
jgi:hypothetical protein